MKNNMLSNKKWFLSYSRIRTILILALVLVALSKFLPSFYSEYEQFWNVLFSILTALLITVLLFDYFQKPSFLELSKVEKGIRLKLYKPDARYFFFLKKNAIKTQLISNDDKLTYRIYKKILPAFNQIEFFIKKSGGNIIKSDKINIGWMSEEQLIKLNSIIKLQK